MRQGPLNHGPETSERQNRREFLEIAGASLLAGSLPGSLGARRRASHSVVAPDPDLVVFGANVYTMDGAAPRAEAFAIKDSRFVAVGRTSDIKPLAGRRTATIDARQMTVVPGFIDCHNHARGTTLLYEVLVGNPFEVEFVTIASIVDKLRAKASATPPGNWVEGYFFDDTKLKDKRPLDVHDLDRVSTEHPVAVHHRGGHTSFYNSKALELGGVTPAIKDMPSGTYDRDSTGALNGRVTDRARSVFDGVGTRPTFTPEQRAE